MLISTRESCRELAKDGIPERRTRLALRMGLAGAPIKTSAEHLFESDRVRELGSRRTVGPSEMAGRCPAGYYVSRRAITPGSDRADLLRQLNAPVNAPGDGISGLNRVLLGLDVQFHGPLPFVATVAGFVVLAAEITEVGRDTFEFGDPGTWFDGLSGTQLDTGRGRSWTMVRPSSRTARGAA